MSQFETISSQTQRLINYNAANDNNIHRFYRTSRVQPDSYSEPLKKFHQYFGKIQPSLYVELKNIFQNSSFEDRATSPQPDYHIQGIMVGSRGRQFKPRDRKQLSPINHFTIQSLHSRSLYRKAKLNRLIYCHEELQKDPSEEKARTILRQSDQLVSQLHQTLTKQRTPRMNITQKTFRVSKGSSIEKESFAQLLNPTNRQRFTQVDLNQAICLLHHVDVQLSPNISYFNVFIEQGNNSQLLKSLVRKRNGWRVVEIPAVANLIWTQFYRKSILKKRLHKREKSQTEEDKQKMMIKAENIKRPKIISSEKRYESTKGSQLSPNKSAQTESFLSEAKKLIPPCEVEVVAKMKKSVMKTLKTIQVSHNILVHNHFPFNCCISDKKNLLFNLTRHFQAHSRNVFQLVPQTFQLNDLNHPIVQTLQQELNCKQHWMIKPGENSNRGRGITIAHSNSQAIEQLKRRLNEEVQERQSIPQRRKRRSIILQRYIKPLLYCGRKFDIRSYMLVTFLSKQLRMYCYEECYIRTSSKPFDIDSTNRLVHLTNDAIQSHSADYGKFEEGNKVAEVIFARFIDEEHKKKNPNSNGVWHDLKVKMQNRCVDVLESSYESLLKSVHKPSQQQSEGEESYYFQLFGMDFMIDEDFGLWLIQVNTNPAITHDCSRVLNHLIPKMLDNAFAIAIEPIMRPLRIHDIPYNNQFTAVFKKTVN